MSFATVERELFVSRSYFQAIAPGWTGLLRGQVAKVAKVAGIGYTVAKSFKAVARGNKTGADIVGEIVAQQAMNKALSPVRNQVTRAHKHVRHMPRRDMFRKNGLGGRGWYYEPGRKKMVIVFHDANRAGPHIDVHIGRVSVIRRVKPEVYEQLKFNREGMLTQNSQKVLLDFLKEEIDNGSRIPQNLDHTLSNARASWVGGSRENVHYGAATTRQVILEEEVDVYKAHADGPIEFYAPSLNPHRGMYLYRLYKGDDTRAPILIWGNLKNNPPQLEDRLHLKLTHPEQLDKLNGKVDLSTATAKYDGSSCYLVIDKKGTTVWSPRQSVRTGEQIEYTFKLDGIANVTSDEKIVAMGELLFTPRRVLPFKRNDYLAQATAGGLLNNNAVLPRNVKPEIRLYRVDRIGRSKHVDDDFWSNRRLQEQVAQLDSKLKVVELMPPEKASNLGFEGFVVVPPGASVNDGFKVKWWMDPHDWKIDRISFLPGPKGGQAGVIHCTSLESGKKFKLGPGQVGDRELTDAMMRRPQDYEGAVLRVHSRHGHEGRASKVLGFHDDKGRGVPPSEVRPDSGQYYQLDPKNPYVYRDEQGNELFRVRRAEGRFIQEHPTPGGWKPGRAGTPDVLYQLPELLQRKDEPVYIVEGEKDVNRLQEAGLLATTNPAGAGKWRDEHARHLNGRDIIILPDNDAVGHRHATQVAKSVSQHARSVKVVHLPGTGNKEDVYDWLDKGNSTKDLQQLIQSAPDVRTGKYDLVFYSERSTPQVVERGALPKPKVGFGDVTLRRPATPREEVTLDKGKWLRVDEYGNKPSSPNYKKTRYRPELVR